MSISELALVAKPTILIPSPHVSEDHQTKNALSLVERGAAILVTDKEVESSLREKIETLLNDVEGRAKMQVALRSAARPHASIEIVDVIEKLLKK